MPNYVINKLRIEADDALTDEILEAIKDDKLGRGTIDFNKLIPMPPALDIEAGSRSNKALIIYQTMNDYGITYRGDGHFEYENPEGKGAHPDEVMKEYADAIKKDPEIIEFGKICFENKAQFGHPTWYEWNTANWGSKWNAMNQEDCPYEEGSGVVTFDTAWSAVPKVIARIAEMFPAAKFVYQYADEDLGHNLGEIEFMHGGLDGGHGYEGRDREAFEFAAGLWGIPISGPGAEYLLSHDGSRYVYLEDYGYDVIEVLGKPAIHSGSIVPEYEFPAIMHRYPIGKYADMIGVFPKTGHSYSGVEYRGCVLTKEALNIDQPQYIAEDSEGFPKVIKEGVSFRSFLDNDFASQTMGAGQSENESPGMRLE